jgi:hypothetical protein
MSVQMTFNPEDYGPEVAAVLKLDGSGHKLMPLVIGSAGPPEALEKLRSASPAKLFPGARAPEAALSGLWLYFSAFEESHALSQDLATPEGSFWHAILHRREPDPGNAGYWFRRVGKHPVFVPLLEAARAIGGYAAGPEWDALAFIDFCERARRSPGSPEEDTARRIQLAEWQLLFDHCARPR